jgi:hypothetical protein
MTSTRHTQRLAADEEATPRTDGQQDARDVAGGQRDAMVPLNVVVIEGP